MNRIQPKNFDTEFNVQLTDVLCLQFAFKGRAHLIFGYCNASINFTQNHPQDKSPGHNLKGAKIPWDNHCVQKPSPRDKTESQKPHPWDIKLENFTNVSINSDTI